MHGRPLLLFVLSLASASAEARHQHDVSMTEEECADCVLSDEETARLRELYVVHTSREQRIMLCAPMFDHVFGDFDTPRSYERCFTTARGFGPAARTNNQFPTSQTPATTDSSFATDMGNPESLLEYTFLTNLSLSCTAMRSAWPVAKGPWPNTGRGPRRGHLVTGLLQVVFKPASKQSPLPCKKAPFG